MRGVDPSETFDPRYALLQKNLHPCSLNDAGRSVNNFSTSPDSIPFGGGNITGLGDPNSVWIGGRSFGGGNAENREMRCARRGSGSPFPTEPAVGGSGAVRDPRRTFWLRHLRRKEPPGRVLIRWIASATRRGHNSRCRFGNAAKSWISGRELGWTVRNDWLDVVGRTGGGLVSRDSVIRLVERSVRLHGRTGSGLAWAAAQMVGDGHLATKGPPGRRTACQKNGPKGSELSAVGNRWRGGLRKFARDGRFVHRRPRRPLVASCRTASSCGGGSPSSRLARKGCCPTARPAREGTASAGPNAWANTWWLDPTKNSARLYAAPVAPATNGAIRPSAAHCAADAIAIDIGTGGRASCKPRAGVCSV